MKKLISEINIFYPSLSKSSHQNIHFVSVHRWKL